MIRMLQGDCRVTLPTVETGIAQVSITSIPYWGLRDYGTPPLVWGQTCCEHPHEWGAVQRAPWANEVAGPSQNHPKNGDASHYRPKGAGQFCDHVHDWCEVLVLGRQPDTSASSTLNNSPARRNEIDRPMPGRTSQCWCGAWRGSLGLEPTPDLYIDHIVECFRHVRRVLRDDGLVWLNSGDSYAGSGKGPSKILQHGASCGVKIGSVHGDSGHTSGVRPPPGVKAKDLVMIPFRVAMALQADGWWLRSVIPWLKRNAMPESVTDRPATSIEYVFLLSKSARYFWNADAVRVAQSENTHARGNGHTPKETEPGTGVKANSSFHAATNGQWLPNGRNRRNGDWFFESWQGLMLDEQDDPLALVVNPQPFSGAHFATFPTRLVEPMVKASTRPGDTILDPFAGSGTVGLVADRLGRDAVLCELKPEYAEMGTGRIVGDAPMFTEVAAD